MSVPTVTPSQLISLKGHPDIKEQWLQQQIIDNPSILGLGDLEVYRVEKQQPTGGRVDLILQDDETRYEVEIQLGSLDESHIIRTIEYWDVERRRQPKLSHIAVIVAEEVTSRFLNVISLIASSIPLIVIQMKGIQMGEQFTLIGMKVVDHTLVQADLEEDAGAPVDRAAWERRSSKESMVTLDKLIEIVNEVQPGTVANYRQQYIGLATGGVSKNIMLFWPKKNRVVTGFRISEDEDLATWADERGLSYITFRRHMSRHHFSIRRGDVEEHRDHISRLVQLAING